MAQIITIANNKGGTGKTATAVSFGAALRLRGYDVLLIDADGQANATATLNVPTDAGTTYDTLQRRDARYIEPVRVLNVEGGAGVLDVLPSCSDLSAIDVEIAEQPDRLTRFSTVVDKYRDKYDAVIIDTPPALGILSLSALYTADVVIIPTEPHYLAAKGIISLNNAAKAVTANRAVPVEVDVLFTRYDKRLSLHRLTVEQVTGAGFRVLNTKIRNNVALSEAPAANLDIFRYAPKSNGAADYDALTSEYLNTHKLRHLKHNYK